MNGSYIAALGFVTLLLAGFLAAGAWMTVAMDPLSPPLARLGAAAQFALLFILFAVGVMGILAAVFSWAISLWGGFFGFCLELVWLGVAYLVTMGRLNDMRPRPVPPLEPALPSPPLPNAPAPPAAPAPAAPKATIKTVTTTETST